MQQPMQQPQQVVVPPTPATPPMQVVASQEQQAQAAANEQLIAQQQQAVMQQIQAEQGRQLTLEQTMFLEQHPQPPAAQVNAAAVGQAVQPGFQTV